MEIKTKLIAAAERLFDRHGFMATGMDRLTEAADMSSQTLYKHVGSKAGLMAARARRARPAVHAADRCAERGRALRPALENWVRVEGTRGCLFLRAQADTGGDTPEVAEAVATHKAAFTERIGDVLAADLGGGSDPVLAEQILVLFEGCHGGGHLSRPGRGRRGASCGGRPGDKGPTVTPAFRLGIVGFGLIAVCYGFARFAFGLFLPQVDADLSLGSTLGSGPIDLVAAVGCA